MNKSATHDTRPANDPGNTFLLIGLAAVLLIALGGRVPGPFIVPAASLAVLASCWLAGQGFRFLGFRRPSSWASVLLTGLAAGAFLALFGFFVLFPLLEALGAELPDYSLLAGVRGDPVRLLLFLVIAWTSAALGEEIVFRGFFFGVAERTLGIGRPVTILAVTVNAAVFGLAHSYQGTSGILLTGFAGLVLAVLFLLRGRNIWFAVVAHGMTDTIAFVALFSGWLQA